MRQEFLASGISGMKNLISQGIVVLAKCLPMVQVGSGRLFREVALTIHIIVRKLGVTSITSFGTTILW
jgi:hypothetical protein